MNIIETTNRTNSLTKQLLEVWESAVRQTHTFLSESEILRIKGYVPDAIGNVARLLVSMDESDIPVAFLGLEGSRIEMLFVDTSHRGQGIGKQLSLCHRELCSKRGDCKRTEPARHRFL